MAYFVVLPLFSFLITATTKDKLSTWYVLIMTDRVSEAQIKEKLKSSKVLVTRAGAQVAWAPIV